MLAKQLYDKNPKNFEKFLLRNYHSNFSLKLQEFDDEHMSFNILLDGEYYDEMVVTDFFVKEPGVADCSVSVKSQLLMRMLAKNFKDKYIAKFTQHRLEERAELTKEFDDITETLLFDLNKYSNDHLYFI